MNEFYNIKYLSHNWGLYFLDDKAVWNRVVFVIIFNEAKFDRHYLIEYVKNIPFVYFF